MIIKAKFGGLNTDIDPILLPSGTAVEALNVTVENGDLKRRQGFSQWEDDVTGSGDGVLNQFVARFTDGSTYLVCKCDDGGLWQRKIDPSGAASFTQITTGHTHNSSDRGWFFMWADRMHYFDRGGGSRWNPNVNSGVAYKAGMPVINDSFTVSTKATTTPVGGKHGWYHFHRATHNITTLEEGQAGPPIGEDSSENPIELRTAASPSTGAAEMTIPAHTTAYEVNASALYCTLGDTEYLASSTANTPSGVAYLESRFGAVGTLSFLFADHQLARQPRYTNAGGEPRGSAIGFYTGKQALYGKVYETVNVIQGDSPGGALMPGLFEFSIPNFPTSIPRRRTYLYGTLGSYEILPKPWEGHLRSGVEGAPVAMAYGGGLGCVFTNTAVYLARNAPDGRMALNPLTQSKGCVADGAAVGTFDGVHSLGYRSWLSITPDGFNDIADRRFSATLEDIPDDQQGDARLGYYGYRNQVWAAVTKSGATVAKRILVWDVHTDKLVIFEPACLSASQGITSMVELAAPGDEPVMLVGTSTGEIFKYPDGTDDDGDGYAANWKGFFAQESRNRSQRIGHIEAHLGSYVAKNVDWKLKAYRTSSASPTEYTGTFSTNDRLESLLTTLGRIDARMYSIEFASPSTCTNNWDIHGVVWKIGTTDKK